MDRPTTDTRSASPSATLRHADPPGRRAWRSRAKKRSGKAAGAQIGAAGDPNGNAEQPLLPVQNASDLSMNSKFGEVAVTAGVTVGVVTAGVTVVAMAVVEAATVVAAPA